MAVICDTGPPTDARLLERIREGDQPAFEALVSRYRSALLAHCRAIVGDTAAQDAVQQAFLNAWNSLLAGCQVRDARAWLFTIAHRCAIQLLRERSRHDERLPDDLPGDRSPEERLQQTLRAREALVALAGLAPREREALIASSLYDRSGRDTARALGISEVAARQLIHRARGRARSAAARLATIFVGLRRPGFAGRDDARAWIAQGLARADSLPLADPLPRIVSLVVAGVVASSPLVALRSVRTDAVRSGPSASARSSSSPAAVSGRGADRRPARRGRVPSAAAHTRRQGRLAQDRPQLAPGAQRPARPLPARRYEEAQASALGETPQLPPAAPARPAPGAPTPVGAPPIGGAAPALAPQAPPAPSPSGVAESRTAAVKTPVVSPDAATKEAAQAVAGLSQAFGSAGAGASSVPSP